MLLCLQRYNGHYQNVVVIIKKKKKSVRKKGTEPTALSAPNTQTTLSLHQIIALKRIWKICFCLEIYNHMSIIDKCGWEGMVWSFSDKHIWRAADVIPQCKRKLNTWMKTCVMCYATQALMVLSTKMNYVPECSMLTESPNQRRHL